MPRFLAASAFFLRLTLGFSYCSFFLKSPMIPSRAHFLLKRLNALSKDSFSPTLTVDKTHTPPSCREVNVASCYIYIQTNYTKFPLFVKKIARLLRKNLYYSSICRLRLAFLRRVPLHFLPCQNVNVKVRNGLSCIVALVYYKSISALQAQKLR